MIQQQTLRSGPCVANSICRRNFLAWAGTFAPTGQPPAGELQGTDAVAGARAQFERSELVGSRVGRLQGLAQLLAPLLLADIA